MSTEPTNDDLAGVLGDALHVRWMSMTDTGRAGSTRLAQAVLDALRALPVEARMEAMGMERASCERHTTCQNGSMWSDATCIWREVDVDA